ncbi:Inositol-trisphosphate 3-kinase B [Nymphon striatum]|nr:Inositol-trisphosphate 3-kinase B [Nymphon striatum]
MSSTADSSSFPQSTEAGTGGGYEEFRRNLLPLNISTEYADPSSDDLSSDWDSNEEPPPPSGVKPSGWRKVRNVVHWSPFVQTYKNHKYRWVQLAGHQGNFRAGEQGTILKKLCNREDTCLNNLMKDILKPFVPDYKGEVDTSDGKFVQLQDLLADFENPCVMDIKMGVRTYLEEELAKAKEKTKLRKDMYEKMVQIDSNEPTEEEHKLKAITKPRYMLWRETISSTASLGFRIEGVKKSDGTSSKDFKTTKTKEQVSREIIKFTGGDPSTILKYTQKLIEIRDVLQKSSFFKDHELIGSSLLFVHDETCANIWLIDFAKTLPVPEGLTVNHTSPWIVGNHEDGYLIGLENLISIFSAISNT